MLGVDAEINLCADLGDGVLDAMSKLQLIQSLSLVIVRSFIAWLSMTIKKVNY